MLRKFLPYSIIFLFFLFPPLARALVSTPQGLTLVPGEQSIEVRWIANSDDTTHYYLYWGLSPGNIEPPLVISGRESNSHTLAPLLPGTTYYVALSAYDNNLNVESARSDVLSATTLDTGGLSAPTGLWINPVFGIGTTSAGFTWTASEEPDISYYTLYYGTATGIYGSSRSTADASTFLNVTGLTPSTRYYFALSVTTLSAESARSAEIVVDTLPDSNPPNVPGTPGAVISGNGEIEITFSDNNENMADFSHFVVAYDVNTSLSNVTSAGAQNIFILGGLTVGSDYYFAVKAVDTRGNESALSGTGHIFVEEVKGYLDESTMKEGCFIATAVFGSYDHPLVQVLRDFRDSYLKNNAPGRAFIHFYYEKGPLAAAYVKKNNLLRALSFLMLLPFIAVAFLLVKTGPAATVLLFLSPFLLKRRRSFLIVFVMAASLLPSPERAVAGESNTFGMKIGYFSPSDDLQSDYYDPTPLISLFYDRKIVSYLSTELSAGYLYREGNALTISGKETAIESELTMVPLSVSLKLHLPLSRYIGTYLGAGGDYWYFKEKSKISDESLEVGGYHGKVGLVLKKMPNLFDDKYTRNFKVTLEAVYSRIDRFNDNETDLGGWTFNAGASISF